MVEEPHTQPTDPPPALTNKEPQPEWAEWLDRFNEYPDGSTIGS